jgi:subfamily B ATP-binding cassette protein MsbA
VHYVSQVRFWYALSLFLLLLTGLLTAAKAWIIQPVIDSFLEKGSTMQDLLLLCGAVMGIFIGQAVFSYLYGRIERVTSQSMVRQVREDLFQHLLKQSLGYFTTRPSSDAAVRIVTDVTMFQAGAVGNLQHLFREVTTVLFLVGVVCYQNWRLAGLISIILVVVGAVLRVMTRRIHRLGRQGQEMLSGVANQLTEIIGGIDLVRSLGLGGLWKSRFRDVNQKHYETEVRAGAATSAAIAIVQIVVALGLGGILLLTGTSLLRGDITPGQFMSFLATMYLVQTPALGIASSASNMARGFAAGGRALELLDDQPTLTDPERPRALPPGHARIECRDLTFSYGSERVLEDLTFSVAAGEMVVMVGDSGAGKSTVAKVLLRFYDPDSGQVLLNGVPLPELKREDVYKVVTYVAQDVYLFDETLEFNIKMGKPEASDAEVRDAVRAVGLTKFVESLPEGLATRVGERGVRLSGGQRQRVALARAVLTDAQILVLDEATSALDMDLEKRVLQSLVNLRRDRAIFAITHRLSMAEIADRVLVLKEGRLVEEGTAAQLAGTGGEFARLSAAARAKLVRGHGPVARESGSLGGRVH